MRVTFIVTIMLLIFTNIFSYTYSAWTSMTGAKTMAINPFFYGSFEAPEMVGTDLVVGYGFSDNVDMFASIATLSPLKDGEYISTWILPRYAISENKIIGLGMNTDWSGLIVSPQFHTFAEMGSFIGELNVRVDINVEDAGNGLAAATAGAVWKLKPDILYPFLEFNPSLSYGDESVFDFNIAPGLWYAIKDTPHQFSVSIPLSGIKDGEVSAGFNLWYWYSFTL